MSVLSVITTRSPLVSSGYCGADIKALCTEAALASLRRRYPQIYGSSVKLQLDVSSIVLGPQDFSRALRAIIPASQRALAPPGRALSPALRPLLAGALTDILGALLRVFPHAEQRDRDDSHGKPGPGWVSSSGSPLDPLVCPGSSVSPLTLTRAERQDAGPDTSLCASL